MPIKSINNESIVVDLEGVTDDVSEMSVDTLSLMSNAFGNASVMSAPIEWESGSINSTTGEESDNAYRARTVGYIGTGTAKFIIANDKRIRFRVHVLYYDSNHALVTSVLLNAPKIYEISKDYPYMRLVVYDYTNGSYQNYFNYKIASTNIMLASESTWVNELEDKIDQTKSELSQSVLDLAVYTDPLWEQGNITSTDGSVVESNYRCRTKSFLSTEIADTILIDKSQKTFIVFICYYDSDKEFVESVGPIRESEVAVGSTYPYYKLVAVDYTGNKWNNVITPSDCYSAYTLKKTAPAILEINERLDAMQEDETYPDYFESQVDSAVNSILQNQMLAGKNGETFLFITDSHWDNNAKNSPALVRHIIDKCGIKHVINGGDLISQDATSKQPMIESMRDCAQKMGFKEIGFKVLFGNHDMNQNGVHESNWMTEAEFFSIAQSFMGRGIDEYGDYFYFYYDDPSSKTRFICLDTRDDGVISSEQFAWFDRVVQVENGWHVLVFAHWLYQSTTWNRPLEGGDWTASAETLFSKCDNASNVEGIFCGHLHADMDTTTDGGIKVVVTDTDSLGAHGAYSATRGTTSEQCFDVTTVDYERRTINCVRVGRGVSRSFTY